MLEQKIAKNNLYWIPPLLIIYNFCANLTNDIYLPSLPRLVQVFSTTASTLQLTMSAWFAGVAIPQFLLGPITDRFGRRPVLFLGAICFLIATVICALATNVWMLIVARFFQGVGVCSLNVTTFAILIDLFDYKKRIHVLNKISMCGTLAPLIGPVLGGYLLITLGWRSNFFIIFILSFVSIVGLWMKLPESNLYLNPHALHFKNILKNYYLLLKNKMFLKNLIPYCMILGGLIAYLTAAPFIIISKLKISAENFGFTQLPIFGTYIIGSIYLNTIDDEAKIKKLRMTGIVSVFLGGLLLLATSYLFGNQLFFFIMAMVIYACGFSLCASSLINEVMSTAILTKGSAAAFLGFGMAASCMLSSFCVGLLYNGEVLTIAVLIFAITTIASAVYFTWQEEVPIEYESSIN